MIENALVYSPSQSSVVIRALPGSLVVEDEGPGIAAGEEDAIFERLVRGSAGKTITGGTGSADRRLGLPIARTLLQAWGGTVRLENRGTRGARATLVLPDSAPPVSRPLPTLCLPLVVCCLTCA